MVNPGRVTLLKNAAPGEGPVIYWMSRDQRISDNWALLFASELAASMNKPLAVLFCLVPSFLNATDIHFRFMLGGLAGVQAGLKKLDIPFILRKGIPEDVLPPFFKEIKASVIVTDFNPLKISKGWKEAVMTRSSLPFYEVDAHNIVPCRIASQKQEFSARTIRPKIHRLLHEYLTEFPVLRKNEVVLQIPPEEIKVNGTTAFGIIPGEEAAGKVLEDFIEKKLGRYEAEKNDPSKDALSGLSPYLHFGQISAQRVAIEVLKSGHSKSADVFLEELIVRKELADNFCHYNDRYDSFEGFPAWAQKTLNEHRSDIREFLYGKDAFENAETHDALWNAAQKEMLYAGKMHGYMRMYWAKKILEWSTSPEEALETAIYLNDKYSLDGRDPNGYAGIAWSAGGVHDRPWFTRPVFGSVRYMSASGLSKKFNTSEYIRQHSK